MNQARFLPDPIGNSRFWCIPVVRFNDSKDIDMQQMWAEIKRYCDTCVENREDYIWWLTDAENAELDKGNEVYELPSNAEDLISARLDLDVPCEQWRFSTLTDLLVECGCKAEINRGPLTAAGMYMGRAGFPLTRKGNIKGYFVPPVKKFGGDSPTSWNNF